MKAKKSPDKKMTKAAAMNSSPRNPLPLGMGSSGHHNRLPKENH
jgi:hypothetical protein